MSNRFFRLSPRGFIPRPLDVIGASAYASVSVCRRTRGAYTGPLIRVRRDSDNAEQDIPQVGGNGLLNIQNVDTFSLGTDSWLATLYDQSGNGNDLIQSTAGDQAQVVDGKILKSTPWRYPVAQFTSHSIAINDAAFVQPATIVVVFYPFSHTSGNVIVGGGSAGASVNMGQSASGTLPFIQAGSSANGTVGVSTGAVHVVGFRWNGGSSTILVDNNAEDTGLSIGATNPEGITIGSDGAGANNANMNFLELHAFNSAISGADMTALIENINSFYRIY